MDVIGWARRSSPWIIHFNAGACNGCDIEVLAALTPRFDLERFGVLLQASPRHGDVLVVTGAVTLQVEDRLLRIYCYSVEDGLEYYLPVDVYVPGCPPKPEAVIDGTLKLLGKLEQERGKRGHSAG
ncbi:MAG: hypothetical protein AMJ93_13670 [Anaerolineae bacterium SM23_84]|nr:MAG: hypothetical protein AMJ93_13670 [Anaerolineae bacterium SM23_84]